MADEKHIVDEIPLELIHEIIEGEACFFESYKAFLAGSERDKDRVITDWKNEVNLIENLTFNIAKYLEKKGIATEKS
jgi:hypothetical protein